MASIQNIQQEIIDEFSFFENWSDKYEYLIDMGKNLPLIDDQYKTEDYLIKGCQSRVWLRADIDDSGRVQFSADSEAVITKGIIGLLIRVFSNQMPRDIAEAEPHFIDEIGLKDHLSPTRSNGLAHMVQKMKMYGLAYTAKLSN